MGRDVASGRGVSRSFRETMARIGPLSSGVSGSGSRSKVWFGNAVFYVDSVNTKKLG
jgi:hypothetical protein